MTIEGGLLEFARALRWEDLPHDVRTAVVALSADALANAVCGRAAADTPAIEAASSDLYGPGFSTIIAGGLRSMVAAVGVNAFQMTAYTMCDVYRPGLCHVTPEVVPAALCIGERRDVDGVALLTAIAAGLEATTRLCNAFNYRAFRARGWHSPGVAGAMGASVTAGLLSGLNMAELEGCLGLAGAQAGGTFASMGTMAVKFHQMRGAQAGVIAALHAERGLLGSSTILSATDGGLLTAFSDDPQPNELLANLGERWHLLEISLRPYPAASTLQSLINVLLGADVEISQVKRVHVQLPPDAYRMGGEADWESELRAMQSARYVTSSVLFERSCWTDLFDDAHRHNERINEFASEHVDVSVSSELIEGAVRVIVDTNDGEVELSTEFAEGDPRNPLNDEQLLAKLRRSVRGSPLENRFDVRRLLNLQHETSIAKLMSDVGAPS